MLALVAGFVEFSVVVALLRSVRSFYEGRRRPLHIIAMGAIGLIGVSCVFPVIAFLHGRVDTSNNHLQTIRTISLVMNWMSTIMSTLTFLVSILKTVSIFIDVPVPAIFSETGWETATSATSFFIAAGAFIEDSRNAHGNGHTCDLTRLKALIKRKTNTTVTFNCQTQRDLVQEFDHEWVPGGMMCDMDCDNGYHSTTVCYDFGLVGGVWSGVYEDNNFESFSNRCKLRKACSNADLHNFVGTQGTVSCPKDAYTSIGAKCSVQCANCPNVQIGTACRFVEGDLNGVTDQIAWTIVSNNDLGCYC